MQAVARRHFRTVGVLRTATEISPTMGLIVTLVGLGQMLGDQSTINPSMAVALLMTFFVTVLANTIFSPFASKLKRNSSENVLINQIHFMATASMARHENPWPLDMMANTILQPGLHIEYFGLCRIKAREQE